MEFFEVVRKRQSIRKFKEKEVEEEKIRKIIDAAISAPSAGNLQAYEIIIIKSQEKKEQLAEAALGQKFIAEASVVFVVCANENRSARIYGKRGKELYCINDASIAAAYVELAATALGLGSVWVGAFDDISIRKIINAPPHVRPIAIIPVGYAAEKPFRTKRRKEMIYEKSKFNNYFFFALGPLGVSSII